MERGPQPLNPVLSDSGYLWQVQLPQGLPFIVCGIPRSFNPDIANLESPLIADFVEHFVTTKLLLIETVYPERYQPKHVIAPIAPKAVKPTSSQAESWVRDFTELLFAQNETTCCLEYFSSVEKYKLLCQILGTYGYIITSKQPNECKPDEINLAYITTSEIMLTLTLIAMKSGIRHFEKLIVDKAKEFGIGVVGLRDIHEHVELFRKYVPNFQKTIEQFIVEFEAPFLSRQQIESDEDATYRIGIEECWLLRNYRVIDQLNNPMAMLPFYQQVKTARNTSIVDASLAYLHQENVMVLIDIENITSVLQLYSRKGAKLRCLTPQPDFREEGPILPGFNRLRISTSSSSSSNSSSPNAQQDPSKKHAL